MKTASAVFIREACDTTVPRMFHYSCRIHFHPARLNFFKVCIVPLVVCIRCHLEDTDTGLEVPVERYSASQSETWNFQGSRLPPFFRDPVSFHVPWTRAFNDSFPIHHASRVFFRSTQGHNTCVIEQLS